MRYSRLFLILSFGAKPCAHPLFRLRCERIRSRASELTQNFLDICFIWITTWPTEAVRIQRPCILGALTLFFLCIPRLAPSHGSAQRTRGMRGASAWPLLGRTAVRLSVVLCRSDSFVVTNPTDQPITPRFPVIQPELRVSGTGAFQLSTTGSARSRRPL